MPELTDALNLGRFVIAQETIYETALAEIRRGRKVTHWMWFIFPQLHGLGSSDMAKQYAIRGRNEAVPYLAHSVLGTRYRQCVTALQDLDHDRPQSVFGEVDARKLHASLTLFCEAMPSHLLIAALERWFGGQRDAPTMALLAE